MPAQEFTPLSAPDPDDGPDCRLHAAQLRALLLHDRTLAMQIADLTIGQQGIVQKLDEGQRQIKEVAAQLAENTTTTNEVRDLLAAIKGGGKLMGWMGKGVGWAGGLAAACTALYTGWYMLTHGGNLPGSK